jgi:altronate dehydratase small subunit
VTRPKASPEVPFFHAIQFDATDNVAIVLADLAAGCRATVRTPDGETVIEVGEVISLCHKVAVREIAPGELVVKQGHPIGRATQVIGLGQHAHVHNIEGLSSGRNRSSGCKS